MKRRWHRHGYAYSRIYKIWSDMQQRCTNPNSINYERYGGRGITVCDKWLEDFREFKAWADSQGYDDEAEMRKERRYRLTLDRIDSNGDYCPENCRWATYEQQIKNRRNTIRLEYDGEEKTIGEISEIVGVDYNTLYRRLMVLNLPLEKAIA